ncbi:hypothetical protein [Alternaria dianthicola negative-stranded RNA virus 1]|uniref:Gp1 n=1 Tax=Alternaria dianthicola negative-stranded RNA virus 1 TaxID=2992032 RepID=A0A9E8AD37_9MONO|nr:hypothetical protein [Alternaria dianthicola negative-stranded RNA virus 1]
MSKSAISDASLNDDSVFPRTQVAKMLTDEQLLKGVIPTSSETIDSAKQNISLKNAKKLAPSAKGKERAILPAGTSQAMHERTLSTDSEKSLYDLDSRMEIMKLKSEIVELRDVVEKQATLISKLTSSDIENRTYLEKLAKLFETENKGIHATIDAKTTDLRKRIDETVQVHRDTPLMVEKLIDKTNEILTYLPEEKKAEIKSVKLTPAEKKTIETVRKQTEIPRKKIPAHLRHLM